MHDNEFNIICVKHYTRIGSEMLLVALGGAYSLGCQSL